MLIKENPGRGPGPGGQGWESIQTGLLCASIHRMLCLPFPLSH